MRRAPCLRPFALLLLGASCACADGAVDAADAGAAADTGDAGAVDDAGHAAVPEACDGPLPEGGEALDFAGAGATVHLVRVLVGQGVGNSGIYDPYVFAVAVDGASVCVTDVAAQSYENTHHNHYDVYAAAAAGVRYELAWGFAQEGEAWVNTHSLTRVDVATGASLGAPIELAPADS